MTDPDLALVERDLERPDVCGVTVTVNGREWICVAPIHDDPPRPGHGQRSERWLHGYPPRSARHYFRRRWPNSDH